MVTADSVGPVPTEAPLAELRRLCPAARAFWYSSEEGRLPAFALRFDGLVAFAIQNDSQPVPGRSADTWILRGTNAILPGGARITDTWGAIRQRYTRMSIVAVGPVSFQIEACNHPHVVLMLGPELLDSRAFIPRQVDAAEIPDTTHIAEVQILTGVNRRHHGATGCS
jgi:hypothetical protein